MLSILEKYVYLETRLQFICKKSCLTKYSYNMSNIFQRFLFCYVFLVFVFWCKTLRPLPEPGFLLQSAGCVHLLPLHWHSPRLLENLSCGRSLWASSSGRVIKLASLSSKHSISEKKKSIIISFDSSESPMVIIKIYHLQDTLERDVAGSRTEGHSVWAAAVVLEFRAVRSVHEAWCMHQLLTPMCHLRIPYKKKVLSKWHGLFVMPSCLTPCLDQ